MLAAKLKTPLQIGRHLVRAFEAGFEAGVKPVDASIVETVLSRRIDDLEPQLIRHGYDVKAWQRDLSVSHQKIGFVAEQLGENDEAHTNLYAFARHPVALGRAGRFQRHLAQRPCLGRKAARALTGGG